MLQSFQNFGLLVKRAIMPIARREDKNDHNRKGWNVIVRFSGLLQRGSIRPGGCGRLNPSHNLVTPFIGSIGAPHLASVEITEDNT
jgi:hypothetical protein